MKRWLLIDDNKRWEDVLHVDTFFGEKLTEEFPDVEFHIARRFQARIDELKKGNWDAVYIDHSLAGGADETGIQILEFLAKNKSLCPKEMIPCTGNSGHYMEMFKMIEEIKKSLTN